MLRRSRIRKTFAFISIRNYLLGRRKSSALFVGRRRDHIACNARRRSGRRLDSVDRMGVSKSTMICQRSCFRSRINCLLKHIRRSGERSQYTIGRMKAARKVQREIEGISRHFEPVVIIIQRLNLEEQQQQTKQGSLSYILEVAMRRRPYGQMAILVVSEREFS